MLGGDAGPPNETGPTAAPWNAGYQPFDNCTRWTMSTVNDANAETSPALHLGPAQMPGFFCMLPRKWSQGP